MDLTQRTKWGCVAWSATISPWSCVRNASPSVLGPLRFLPLGASSAGGGAKKPATIGTAAQAQSWESVLEITCVEEGLFRLGIVS